MQKKINDAFEKIVDDEGNTLKNTLKVLCENTHKTKVFANETAQEFGNIDAKEKNIAAAFILRINTHIKSNAQIKEIINTNMTKINKFLISNTKLRGLIIRAEQRAKNLIEMYQKTNEKRKLKIDIVV